MDITEPVGKPARRRLAIRMFGRDLPWYWTLIILIALLVAMHLGIRLQIKDATAQFLDGFSWLGKGTFGDSSYNLDGRIESTDLAIVADAANPGAAIRIPRVSVLTPGVFWLLRAQLPSLGLFKSTSDGKQQSRHERGNHYPPTNQLHILFDAVDWGELGMEAVLPDIAWVGPYSGAAFEAAGCSEDWWWHRGAFAEKFKLAVPSGNVSLLFRVDSSGQLQQTLEFGTPETSHAIIERRFALPEADDFLDTHPDDWRTLDIRWSFRDHGFNKARNRYCAAQAGITEVEFIDRHVAAVERIMASKGWVFSRNMWVAYRRYAEGGKELTWQSNFAEGAAWEDVQEKRGTALFTAINATVHVEGFPRVPYQPEVIAPLPLPKDRAYASLFDIVQTERAAAASAAALADPLALVLTDATSAMDSSITEVPPATGTADPVPAATEASMPVSNAISTQPVPASAPTSSSVAAPAGGEVAAATVVPPAPAQDEPISLAAGSELPSRELGKHLGIYVRIELSSGRAYVGAVARSDAEAVTLNVRMRSGNASLTLPHKQIRRVIKQ
jgi:hypothetical protein